MKFQSIFRDMELSLGEFWWYKYLSISFRDTTLVNVYVDLVVFTRIAGTS